MNLLQKKMKVLFSFLFLAAWLWMALPGAGASTIGIATGKCTADGRPLLFKNKDRTDNYPSDVNYYSANSGEFSYVFQQNDGQNYTRARMGINNVGFGIVYSTSENLKGAGAGPSGSQLAATALLTCASIQDFRTLLNQTNGARQAHEHYGVIDSSGAGSLFEVDGYSYVEIPIVDSIGTMANTAKYHPNAGPPAHGSTSPDREARAKYLLTHGPDFGLTYQYFVNEIIKDFCHTQQDEDRMPVGQYYTNPVLSRYKTAAGCVIRGAKPGDDPARVSVMWLALSEPSLTVALPFFANVDEIPDFIRSGAPGDGMAGSSDRVRRYVYDYSGGRYADRYADTFVLMDIRQRTLPIQDSLFKSYEQHLPEWLAQSPKKTAENMTNWMFDIHRWAKAAYDSIPIYLPVETSKTTYPKDITIFPNYPNPFNEQTMIEFVLPRISNVNVSVSNTLGQKVWQWQTKHLSAGRHCIRFDVSALNKPLSGGVYFYRFNANGFTKSGKMVYLP